MHVDVVGVAVIREQRPHVVVGYDPAGGYGHPDHVHVHTVTTAASNGRVANTDQ
ncbi:hypothetical protein MAHJHV28_45430 [Mycobacterium avium subsp. hominissuis]